MPKVFTVANILTMLRIAVVPVLFVLAWLRLPNAFLWLFAFSLLTDFVDGKIARWLRQESDLGARLDTWGDVLDYFCLAICAWRLWPVIMYREFWMIVMVIISFAVPILTALAKFRELTSYHTYGAKLSAVIMGLSGLILFFGISPWPFRISAPIFVVASIEEVIMTFVLPKPYTNVRSLWHALQRRREYYGSA